MKTRPAPPWYKLYPASELTNPAYYALSAAERGLLQSMRLAYWIEGSVQMDPSVLARQIRLPESEVRSAQLQRVLEFFERDPDREGALIEPLLRGQRAKMDLGTARMSEGGKKGADATNSLRRMPKAASADGASATSVTGYPAGSSRGPSSSSSSSSTSPSSLGTRDTSLSDPWVQDYAAAEARAAPSIGK